MEENRPEQTDQNGEPIYYWGLINTGNRVFIPEPTILLSEALSFAEWCSRKQWVFSFIENIWWNKDAVYIKVSTSELLEIFRSGKENLND